MRDRRSDLSFSVTESAYGCTGGSGTIEGVKGGGGRHGREWSFEAIIAKRKQKEGSKQKGRDVYPDETDCWSQVHRLTATKKTHYYNRFNII